MPDFNSTYILYFFHNMDKSFPPQLNLTVCKVKIRYTFFHFALTGGANTASYVELSSAYTFPEANLKGTLEMSWKVTCTRYNVIP